MLLPNAEVAEGALGELVGVTELGGRKGDAVAWGGTLMRGEGDGR